METGRCSQAQGKAKIAYHYMGGQIRGCIYQTARKSETSNWIKEDRNVESNYARSNLEVAEY